MSWKGTFGDLTVSNTAPLQGLRCMLPTRGCRQRDYCNQGAVQRSTPHQQHVWHPPSICVGSIDSESIQTEIQPGQGKRLFCSYFNFCSPPAPGLKRDVFCWELDQDALLPFPLSLNCHGERWLSQANRRLKLKVFTLEWMKEMEKVSTLMNCVESYCKVGNGDSSYQVLGSFRQNWKPSYLHVTSE